MNLKEEIQDKICHNKTVYRFADNGKAITEHWDLIKKEDAIEIAEKYAIEMCKKQREQDKQALLRELIQFKFPNGYPVDAVCKGNIIDHLNNSPLATGVK